MAVIISPRRLSVRHIASCLLALCVVAASAQAAGKISVAPLPAPKSPSPGRTRVLPQLAQRTAAIRKEAQECAGTAPQQAEFTSRVAVLLDTPSVYSLEVIGEDFCPGAAHPNTWQYGLAYDMTTGRRYHPLHLYVIGTPAQGGLVRLAPAAAQRVKAELLRRADPECRTAVAEQLADTGMSFGLSLQGLNIYFDAPHVVQACFPPITLPYSQIRTFLNRREAARLHWRL
jgi:hypothetical protein